MDLKVKIVEIPDFINASKISALKIVKNTLDVPLEKAKGMIEGVEFFIYENEFENLNIALRRCGYTLAKVVNAPATATINRTTVNLTTDGRIGVVSHRQIGERECLFLGNNVDMITTMLKEYFPSIQRIQVLPEKDSNNNTIRCCCIALSVGGEYNTVEDINKLARFVSLIQDKVQSIVQMILKTGNLYRDFEGTFPKQ